MIDNDYIQGKTHLSSSSGYSYININNSDQFGKSILGYDNVMMDIARKTGWIYLGDCDEAFFFQEFPGGMFRMSNESELHFETLELYIHVREKHNPDQVYTTVYNSMLATNHKVKYQRNIPLGNLKNVEVRFERKKAHAYNSARVTDACVIKGICIKKSITNEDIEFKNRITTNAEISIKDEVGYSISDSFKTKITTIRVNDNPNIKKKYLTTLEDLIIDIWTNEDYGLGEDKELLIIRSDLNVACNLIIDKEYRIFDLLTDVLKSYNMYIYTDGFNFIVDNIKPEEEPQIRFHTGNTINLRRSINFPTAEDDIVAVTCKYYKQGETELSLYTYPEADEGQYSTAGKRSEYYLPGVIDLETVKKTTKYLYNRETLNFESCSFTTELEGYIPELGKKVEVVFNDYINTRTYQIIKYNNNICYVNDTLTEYTNPKCFIIYGDGKRSGEFDGFLTEDKKGVIIPNDLLKDDDFSSFIVLSDLEQEYKTFVLNSIVPNESFKDGASLTTISLNLTEYKEELYI